MKTDDDLITYWDQRLASEGLAPCQDHTPWGAGQFKLLPSMRPDDVAGDLARSAGPWSSTPDPLDMERLDRITYWLPSRDRVMLDLTEQGRTQAQIAKQMSVSQPTVCGALERARERCRAVAEVLERLPVDRAALRSTASRAPKVPHRYREHFAALVEDLCSTWSVLHSCGRVQMAQSSAHDRLRRFIEEHDPTPEHASAVALLTVVRQHGAPVRR